MADDQNRKTAPASQEPIAPETSSPRYGENPSERREYEVGYGKPPRDTRFKPGQSGNPRGRPTTHKNLRTIYQDVLTQRVTLTQNGKRKTVPLIEAALQRMVAEALQGNSRTLLHVLQLAERAGMNEEQGPAGAAPLAADEEQVVADYLRRIGASPEPVPEGNGPGQGGTIDDQEPQA